MTIEIDINKRYIDIWLGHGESAPDLSEIRQQFPGYDMAVLHSGSGNLAALTAELLKTNL